MIDRLQIEREDLRNLVVVIAIMTVVMFFQIDAPSTSVRAISAMVAGAFSGLVFLVVTAVLNVFKPDV